MWDFVYSYACARLTIVFSGEAGISNEMQGFLGNAVKTKN